MSLYERGLFTSPKPVISPWNSHSGFFGGVTGFTWPAANLIIYLPFRVPEEFRVNQFFSFSGATVDGNIDAGIYSARGRKLVSTGSTAMAAGTQTVDVTDYTLGSGLYWLAFTSSSGTATFNGISMASASLLRAMGVQEEAGSGGLPATATFATMTRTVLPGICVTQRSIV